MSLQEWEGLARNQISPLTVSKLALLRSTKLRNGNMMAYLDRNEGEAALQGYGLMGWRCGYIAVLFNWDTLLSILPSEEML